MNPNQEITKILAKVMHNSYKRKEVTERMERILRKMEIIFKNEYLEGEYLRLKEDYQNILKDISKYME